MQGTIHIFGGGTVQHVRNHFALCAPAYGTFARKLADKLRKPGLLNRLLDWLTKDEVRVQLHLTRMADHNSTMETNQDVADRVRLVLADPSTKVIVFNVALCDYEGSIGSETSGKYATRLSSREGQQAVQLAPADKVLPLIRAARPDVLIVGFKTTAGDSRDSQLNKAYRQIAETGVDLVWVNDTVTRENFIVAEDLNVVTPGYECSRLELMAWLTETLRCAVTKGTIAPAEQSTSEARLARKLQH